ncbi:MAG: alanine acetyltransferase [Sandaracinus sp.]|nr:alanine acetyltransferase [Myxococcales bacterium]MAT27368.1 alanine acetyltransferase [Sandaracinus sp.]HJK94749.1 GNAT family N-acetyltransferase [Polyangiaceae bacterium LLY-WYZ-15_(1-7)]MBJ72496.1 alanine acetyltransferase [Sandaracinus sp.]HJL04815.1 GNAT family N-acetyltransferase [Polyangiaceae bacterium LLY-WYZ-15_(1-7)]
MRALRADDEAAFLEACRDSTALHHPWVSPPTDREGFAAYLARESASFRLLLVRRREDDALIGVFNLSQIVRGVFRSAYLGYYGFSATTGRGYMHEGMTLLVHHAFLTIGLHRIEANVRPENRASIALVRRSGFEREGYSPNYLFLDGAWRDHERWAIRREIWRPSEDVEVLAAPEEPASGP